jgi:hypothetical protein
VKNKLPVDLVVKPKSEAANVIIETNNAQNLANFSFFKMKEIKPPAKGNNINNKTIIGLLSPGEGA